MIHNNFMVVESDNGSLRLIRGKREDVLIVVDSIAVDELNYDIVVSDGDQNWFITFMDGKYYVADAYETENGWKTFSELVDDLDEAYEDFTLLTYLSKIQYDELIINSYLA